MEDLEVALTIKLCEYVTWPLEVRDTFRIGVFSDKPQLKNRFKSLEHNYVLNGKHIRVDFQRNALQIKEYQLIFVDEDNLGLVEWLNDELTGNNVLIITENYKVGKEIMFNLLPDKNKGMVSFEFNKTNLIFEGFEIHPDIIELRGSEIDVRELYKQTKDRLLEEEDKVAELRKRIKIQAENIADQEKLIEEQNKDIINKNLQISNQTDSIRSKEQILNSLNARLESQKDEILQKQILLSMLESEMGKANDSLSKQKYSIEEQLVMLEYLNNQIGAKQKSLVEKETALIEKESMIAFRNKMIYLLVFMAVVSIIFLIIALRSSKQNKRAQVILAEQKEELEATLAKLTQAQDQLLHAEKMASLGVLIAGIAHEINNPINFINSGLQGFNSLIFDLLNILEAYRIKYANKKGNEEIDELEEKMEMSFLVDSAKTLLDSMKTGVDRTSAIVKSLRMFSHIDDENVNLVNIHENIDLALTILVNQYKNRIEIVRKYGEIKSIYCMPGKLNQVFMNLITNSIHSISDKGKITISTKQDDGNVNITIEDTGCGIPDNIKSKIFDPFFTTKEVGKGTGLGLGIVFNIIKDHEGKISFDSTEGKGTVFYISLPVNSSIKPKIEQHR